MTESVFSWLERNKFNVCIGELWGALSFSLSVLRANNLNNLRRTLRGKKGNYLKPFERRMEGGKNGSISGAKPCIDIAAGGGGGTRTRQNVWKEGSQSGAEVEDISYLFLFCTPSG